MAMVMFQTQAGLGPGQDPGARAVFVDGKRNADRQAIAFGRAHDHGCGLEIGIDSVIADQPTGIGLAIAESAQALEIQRFWRRDAGAAAGGEHKDGGDPDLPHQNFTAPDLMVSNASGVSGSYLPVCGS